VVLLLTAAGLKRKAPSLFTGLTGIRESLSYRSKAHLTKLHDKMKSLIELLTPVQA